MVACTALLVAGMAAPLKAAEDPDAIIQHGIELRKKGQDDAALIEFRRAYALAKSPRAAAQLGFAEQATGDWATAEGHVQEALTADGDPWIIKNRNTIEGSLHTIQQHTARIDVLGGVDGAEVEVNGRAAGKLPQPESIRVNAGAVDVVVRATGYRPGLRSITVAPGERTKVHFVLETAGNAAGASANLTATEVVTSTRNPPTADSLGDQGRHLRWLGIGVGVAGVALVGVGAICMVTGNHKLDRLESDAAAGRPYDEANGNWKTFQTVSVLLYVAGGAAILGGATAFYFGKSAASDEPTHRTALFVVPTPTGAVLSGRF